MRNLNWNYTLLWFCVTLLIVHTACNKSDAQKPKTATVLASTDCIDTGGIYFPTAVNSFNPGTLFINQAHFIRVCDQVFVSGTFGGSSVDTSQSSFVKFNLPIPSDLTIPPAVNAAGQAIVLQFGEFQPLNATVGFLTVSGPSGVAIAWKSTKKSSYSIAYSFSYTIK